MPNRLGETTNRVVGTKQVLKQLRQGNAATLYLGGDVDETVRQMLEEAMEGQPIEIVNVPTMKELGRICGIDVGAACAALLK
ncbi:MAG: ribosomal L7Ae/L30e/S12e/Gadd45 family protein [Christensenellales bacterium]|jgi:large subunit ribosomal protein L7A